MEFLGENIAFIPVRGGSKSIPLKNIKRMLNKPLVFWVIDAALKSKLYSAIVISTDHDEIKALINNHYGDALRIIERSLDVSTDIATTESVMLEFSEKYQFDTITLLQATSPLLESTHLINAFAEYKKKKYDSLLSVVNQKRFIWEKTANNFYVPTNYDLSKRPRRQNQKGFWVENGAFYITKRELLIKSKNRISKNIGIYEMPESSYFEIDEPNDWVVVESLLKKSYEKQFDLSKIKCVLTDVDGVLTDAGMYYSNKGHALTKFNTRDGMGFKKLKNAGFIVGVISGESNDMSLKRFKKLNLDVIRLGVSDKSTELTNICKEYNLNFENIAYIGDDLNDLEILNNVGFSASPADGEYAIKAIVDFVTKEKGGHGAFREFSNKILD